MLGTSFLTLSPLSYKGVAGTLQSIGAHSLGLILILRNQNLLSRLQLPQPSAERLLKRDPWLLRTESRGLGDRRLKAKTVLFMGICVMGRRI